MRVAHDEQARGHFGMILAEGLFLDRDRLPTAGDGCLQRTRAEAPARQEQAGGGHPRMLRAPLLAPQPQEFVSPGRGGAARAVAFLGRPDRLDQAHEPLLRFGSRAGGAAGQEPLHERACCRRRRRGQAFGERQHGGLRLRVRAADLPVGVPHGPLERGLGLRLLAPGDQRTGRGDGQGDAVCRGQRRAALGQREAPRPEFLGLLVAADGQGDLGGVTEPLDDSRGGSVAARHLRGQRGHRGVEFGDRRRSAAALKGDHGGEQPVVEWSERCRPRRGGVDVGRPQVRLPGLGEVLRRELEPAERAHRSRIAPRLGRSGLQGRLEIGHRVGGLAGRQLQECHVAGVGKRVRVGSADRLANRRQPRGPPGRRRSALTDRLEGLGRQEVRLERRLVGRAEQIRDGLHGGLELGHGPRDVGGGWASRPVEHPGRLGRRFDGREQPAGVAAEPAFEQDGSGVAGGQRGVGLAGRIQQRRVEGQRLVEQRGGLFDRVGLDQDLRRQFVDRQQFGRLVPHRLLDGSGGLSQHLESIVGLVRGPQARCLYDRLLHVGLGRGRVGGDGRHVHAHDCQGDADRHHSANAGRCGHQARPAMRQSHRGGAVRGFKQPQGHSDDPRSGAGRRQFPDLSDVTGIAKSRAIRRFAHF